ncbi:hypothetical protein OPQ81_008078 [Rhizoctonia solani]|nr:hypothetical protein OPQ81_008078 [Rhizoctonia solani]
MQRGTSLQSSPVMSASSPALVPLVSLIVFLPLPSQFSKIEGVEIGEAVQYAYYVVGAVAILVASFVYIGLRKLKGEEGKGFRTLFDSQIGLGYLGGFVARASTVAISAFIPLFAKIYFLDHISDGDQRKAYILASILTGVAQLFALIFAPVFGYLSRRRGHFNYPIIVATVFGIVGYVVFPHLASPEVKNVDGRGGSPAVFVLVALIGISQIGAIVCSLGSLGKGILAADPHKKEDQLPTADNHDAADGVEPSEDDEEDATLLNNSNNGTKSQPRFTRVLLKEPSQGSTRGAVVPPSYCLQSWVGSPV